MPLRDRLLHSRTSDIPREVTSYDNIWWIYDIIPYSNDVQWWQGVQWCPNDVQCFARKTGDSWPKALLKASAWPRQGLVKPFAFRTWAAADVTLSRLGRAGKGSEQKLQLVILCHSAHLSNPFDQYIMLVTSCDTVWHAFDMNGSLELESLGSTSQLKSMWVRLRWLIQDSDDVNTDLIRLKLSHTYSHTYSQSQSMSTRKYRRCRAPLQAPEPPSAPRRCPRPSPGPRAGHGDLLTSWRPGSVAVKLSPLNPLNPQKTLGKKTSENTHLVGFISFYCSSFCDVSLQKGSKDQRWQKKTSWTWIDMNWNLMEVM